MIHTEIQIDASPSAVREAFLDFAAIPTYHTAFLKQITPKTNTCKQSAPKNNTDKQGAPEPGDKLTCTVNNMSFSPIVEVNSATEFTWRGTLGSTMIFTGAHSFKYLEVSGSADKTRFVQSEEFGGALSGIFGLIGQGNTKAGFEKFNEDFKRHVESKKAGQ